MVNMDGDIFRHLSIGRTIFESQTIPTRDIFSHTVTGSHFSPHEWLSGVLFFSVHAVGKEQGLVFLAGLLLAVTFFLVYNVVLSISKNRSFALVLTMAGAMVSSLHWIVRPHLFSMLLSVIWILMLEKADENQRKPKFWQFFTLMVLWVNLHGEFIFGILIWLCYFAGDMVHWLQMRTRVNFDKVGNTLGIGIISFLASMINPVGYRVWGTILGYVGNSYLMIRTEETNSPVITDPRFSILFLAILGTILVLTFSKERPKPSQLFLLAGITLMTLVSARNVHLYGVVVPVALASAKYRGQKFDLLTNVENLFEKFDHDKQKIIWPVIITILLALSLRSGMVGSGIRFSPKFFPLQAADWLKDHQQDGNVFNYFDWGGLLIYELWPEKTVFIDSQTDVYGESITREYETVFWGLSGWEAILKKYDIHWAILPTSGPIVAILEEHGWEKVYIDTTAVIMSD